MNCKFTEQKSNLLVRAIERGFGVRKAATIASVSHETVYSYLRRSEPHFQDFQKSFKEAKINFKRMAHTNIILDHTQRSRGS